MANEERAFESSFDFHPFFLPTDVVVLSQILKFLKPLDEHFRTYSCNRRKSQYYADAIQSNPVFQSYKIAFAYVFKKNTFGC